MNLRRIYAPYRTRGVIERFMSPLMVFIIIWFAITATPGARQSERAPAGLHESFDRLLQKYVRGSAFDYQGIFKNQQDLEQLSAYIDRLESLDPAPWVARDALAYWINLYNAATIELVLRHYPLESIKDIAGVGGSPWKISVVQVAGEELSLDEIENRIIRPQFRDARIHFALNCASIGCPPLKRYAYTGEKLDRQLDEAVRFALNDRRWVEIGDRVIRLSKLFDWYKDDFIAYAGSLRQFIANYNREHAEAVLDEQRDLEFIDYNWKLNSVAGGA